MTCLRCLLPLTLAAAGLVLSAGCLILPSSGTFRSDYGHKPIDDAVLRSLKPGLTTADGVRDSIGKPTHVLADGTVLVYSWTRVRETRVDVVYYTCRDSGKNSAGDWVSGGVRHLLLRFDADGILREKRVRTGGYVDPAAKGIDEAVKFAREE